MAPGIQARPPGGPGHELPPHAVPAPAPPGPEAQQRAAGLQPEHQGESQAPGAPGAPGDGEKAQP